MRKYSCLVLIGLALVTMSLIGQEPAPTEKPAQEKVSAELIRIAELLKDLDHAKFEKRQEAIAQLRKIGKPAIAPLKLLLAAGPSLEVATRASAILHAISKEESKARALRAVLAKTMDLPDGIPANTTLRDCIDFLSSKLTDRGTPVKFLIDADAFQAIGVAKVEEQPVIVPPMKNVKIASILRLVLTQLRGEKSSGTYVVQDDVIVITTTWHTRPREWVAARQYAPVVEFDFDREPLADALRQLADATGVNIVLDPRVSEKGEKLVTATLNEVPVDTAVRLLADMADLKSVALDNVLYVTSRANVREIEAEEAKPKPEEIPGAVPVAPVAPAK